ncbi:MAG TPA: hypothetical protein VGB92_17400 [Longimicrobium sp.]|jgi:hypothetical protein
MADVLDRPVRELFDEASRGASAGAPFMGSGRRKTTKGSGRSLSPAPRNQRANEDAAAAIFSAAFALLVREAVPVMEKLGIPLLAAALREERPGAAVAGLLADIAAESLIADVKGDPLAQAVAASARRRRELLAEAGGGLSTQAVATMLGTSRQAIDKRRRTGTLLAVPMPTGDWAFPAAQFGTDGRPLDALPEALRACNVDDPWMRLAEVLAPDADLGGRSVLQVLSEEGRNALPSVRRVLASVGEHGA